MLGIFIGIAAVVSLISLGNALQFAITGQFGSIDPDKLTVTNAETGFGPPGSTAVTKLNQHDVDIIKKVSGVDVVVTRLIRMGAVKYNKLVRFSYIGSLPKEQEQIDVIYDALNVGVAEGRLLTKTDRHKIVLGNDFTKNYFDKPIRSGTILTIQGEQFEVVGILKKGSSFIMNSVILMPEEDLKSILNITDEYDIIVVQVKDRNQINTVSDSIKKALRKDRHEKIGEEDFSVQTPAQSLQTINTILSIINIVVTGIAAISLLVGGVGITNTMYTAVLERTKEIGVMKAIGARNQDILGIFLLESALLGLVGGLVGALIGLSMAFLITFAVTFVFSGLSFSVSISYPLLLMAISFSLAIGTISGVLPALQAAKLKPVQALRG
jgi:putative ABC transport system permease protein